MYTCIYIVYKKFTVLTIAFICSIQLKLNYVLIIQNYFKLKLEVFNFLKKIIKYNLYHLTYFSNFRFDFSKF